MPYDYLADDSKKESLLITGHTPDFLARPESSSPTPEERYKTIRVFAGASDDSDLGKIQNILNTGLYGSVGTATMSTLSGTSSTPYGWATSLERYGLVVELLVPSGLIIREMENRPGKEVFYEIAEPRTSTNDLTPLYPDEPGYGTYLINPKLITGVWLFDNEDESNPKVYFLGDNSRDSLDNLKLFTTIPSN